MVGFRVVFRRLFQSVLYLGLLSAGFPFAPSFGDDQQLPLGLQKEKPADGRFVETPLGYMVPYTAKVPGSEVEFTMEPIPGGKFKLGSPDSEADRKPDEGPQVEIEVAPFWMARHEVTWSEYQRYMSMHDIFKEMVTKKIRKPADKNHPDIVTAPSNLYDPTFTYSKGKEPKQPAISMSQFAAKQYTKWLSKLSGVAYRLPTEAEWEYACRAGSHTRYYFGDDASQLGQYAWYFDNAGEKLNTVGTKKPNAWGLHDMHGNVAEWVLDEYSPEHYAALAKSDKPLTGLTSTMWPTKYFPRSIRGGSFDDNAAGCRSAARKGSDDKTWRETDPNIPKSPWWFTDDYGLAVGFRIMRTLDDPSPELLKKAWESDLEDIGEVANYRIDEEGRGARAVVGVELLEDAKKTKAKK